MYRVYTDGQAQQQIDALPAEALPFLAELRTLLEVNPWGGDPVNDQYQAIAFGHSVGRAVEMARAALELHGEHRPEIVQLLHRDGVDPNHVFVVPSRLRRPMSCAGP